MVSDKPDMSGVPSFTCPSCDADLVDPENPYCEKCDISWVQCPSCNRLMPAGRSICDDCGMSIPDKGV